MSYTEDVNTDVNIAVVNGGFDDGSSWTPGAEWTIAGGKAIYVRTAGEISDIFQSLPLLLTDNVYDITFTISDEVFTPPQGFDVYLGELDFGTTFSDNGTFTIRASAGAGAKQIMFRNAVPTAGQSGKLDNISIVAIGTAFFNQTEIDHRTVRGAVRYSVPDGDNIYHALSYKDKTNCYIKYTP